MCLYLHKCTLSPHIYSWPHHHHHHLQNTSDGISFPNSWTSAGTESENVIAFPQLGWTDGKRLFLRLVSPLHVEIFINIVFLWRVCNQQEGTAGSCCRNGGEGCGSGSELVFILASKRVMPQRMGGEPQISAHPSNQKEKKEKKKCYVRTHQ